MKAIFSLGRADEIAELGALKIFNKLRDEGAAPEKRLKVEVDILREGYPGLPRLLDANVKEKWLITEYFPGETLEKHPLTFRGDATGALKAFSSLVATISHLHRTGIIHRDIKPANIFILDRTTLIAGDFGIAHRDEEGTRLTKTNERVGPWDYMPQWADLGERLETVTPAIDIYMLGKLLWCMISGRLKLPREYHRNVTYDLTKLFPNDRQMHVVNSLLDRCLVEHESDCLKSAVELEKLVEETLAALDRGVFMDAKGDLELPCMVCGIGFYHDFFRNGRVELSRKNNNNVPEHPINVRVFSCNVCTHQAFFAPSYPEEAAKRKWKVLGN